MLFVSFTLIMDCPCLDLGPVLRMSLITEMIGKMPGLLILITNLWLIRFFKQI